MSAGAFKPCLAFTLEWEGGWSDDPQDPGGATMQGITLSTYSSFLGRQATKDELRNIPEEDRDLIYLVHYWDPVQAERLPSGVDLVTFDAAVNSGVSRAARWLQLAVGADTDGIVGEETVSACLSADPVKTIDTVCELRLDFMRSLPTWSRFGAGWQRRVEAARALAKEMAHAT